MITLVLADDHELFLEGLKDILTKEEDLKIVGLARNGKEALEMVLKHHPDVVVMDLTMPEMNGVEATRRIRSTMEDVKVLALSMHADKRFLAEILKAGATGYALKEGSSAEFIQAIRTVSDGDIYLTPKITSILVKDYLRLLDVAIPSPVSRLSDREKEVLAMLVKGESSRIIASDLHISKNTVDTHRRKIMEKMECGSIAELTRLAIREGLVDLT
ncbi:response regulator [Dethiosulfovibrio salsuginis]|uniref:Two component transcriptional regulator, LuxR family n=1 Tax=Dethiosulfovibrio salsuginis TaxID=561720 RepID=A0A1X7JGL1_9BACT|nr:response regulator transcription factor [Dethiosulfovibrio salsuginis]SMG27000.1 two component transcriptional regulator, LuxR family [Dethiosulfovibrio salsuginis]